MAIFLTEEKKQQILSLQHEDSQVADLFWRLFNRAKYCASRPGICEMNDTSDWWYSCFDYLSNAAMMYALKGDGQMGTYIRDVTMSIVRRSDQEWIGPWFRFFNKDKPCAALETAHLSWAVSVAYDLAGDVFSAEEKEEIVACLKDRAIRFCANFIENRTTANNWNCVITAGLAVAAAVIGDREGMDLAAAQYQMLCGLYEQDGSYCESLQYSNYAKVGLMLAYESLIGADKSYENMLSPGKYAGGSFWEAASYFYHSAQENWDAQRRPRFANFNDSAAIYRPTGDVLLHIATRCHKTNEKQAGVARWLFDLCYAMDTEEKPLDLASFGFNGITGFLTLPLLAESPVAIAPADAGIAEMTSFDCGDTLMRDRWGGDTVIAIHGGPETKSVHSHAHNDLGSFIVAHKGERLLIDPGHSCYRGIIHEIETQTKNHNACTFSVQDKTGVYELEQKNHLPHRSVKDGALGLPLEGFSRKILEASFGDWSAVGYDNAAVYGEPMQQVCRFWFYHKAGTLFVVDRIRSSVPVVTKWHWALNNHGECLEFKPLPPDRFVARRNAAGMKVFHCGEGKLLGPRYGFVHDSYHPLPAQQGEGKSGSAWHVLWEDLQPRTEVDRIHAIALGGYGDVTGWHLSAADNRGAALESSSKKKYAVEVSDNAMVLHDTDGQYEFVLNGSDYILKD